MNKKMLYSTLIHSAIFFCFTLLFTGGLLTLDLLLTDTLDDVYKDYEQTYISNILKTVPMILMAVVPMFFVNAVLSKKRSFPDIFLVNFIVSVPATIIVIVRLIYVNTVLFEEYLIH